MDIFISCHRCVFVSSWCLSLRSVTPSGPEGRAERVDTLSGSGWTARGRVLLSINLLGCQNTMTRGHDDMMHFNRLRLFFPSFQTLSFLSAGYVSVSSAIPARVIAVCASWLVFVFRDLLPSSQTTGVGHSGVTLHIVFDLMSVRFYFYLFI